MTTKQLGEILAELSFGPLASLSWASDGAGTVEAALIPRVTALVNQGLNDLYSRFILLEKEMVIRTMEGRTTYPLRRVHADLYELPVGETDEDRFIEDTEENPFTEDVMRLLVAVDAEGDERSLNDLEDFWSLYTPSHDVIQIPRFTPGEKFFFIFQARHGLLNLDGDTTQNVYLPYPLYPALRAYVAGQIYSGMNGAEHLQKSMEQLAAYEAICKRVEDTDLAKTSFVNTTSKLDERGFK